jgi:hypothetical protein
MQQVNLHPIGMQIKKPGYADRLYRWPADHLGNTNYLFLSVQNIHQHY